MEREDTKQALAGSRNRKFCVFPERSHQVTSSESKSLWLRMNCIHLQAVDVLSKSLLRVLEIKDDQMASDAII